MSGILKLMLSLALAACMFMTGVLAGNYVSNRKPSTPREPETVEVGQSSAPREPETREAVQTAEPQETEAETAEVNHLLSGISAEVLEYSFTKNEKTGWSVFKINSRLENQTDAGLMKIGYELKLLDEDGEELDRIYWSWTGEEFPLTPGNSLENLSHGQIQIDKEVKQILIMVNSALTEEDMPPIHVPQPGEYVYQALNSEHLKNIANDPPVQFDLWIDRGGARWETSVTDPETIDRLVEALMRVRIFEETGIFVTDNYNGFSMTFADGSSYWVSLNLTSLEYFVYGNDHIYSLADFEDFWELMHELTEETDYFHEDS